MEYGIYEKKDKYALHGIFSTLESAQKHLKDTIPEYVKKSYFMDKTLTKDSFEIRPYGGK